VIIVAVRRRNEGTYRTISIKSLSDKVDEIALRLGFRAPIIRNLAATMGIEWISELDEKQIRCLDIGLNAIKDGRFSPLLVAEKIREVGGAIADVETIARDLRRLRHEV
jgi:hypothetical protein